jgi:hypothetical protein
MVPARTVELERALSKFSYYILAVDIALFAALSFIWAPVSLLLPAGRDQGIFAWVAEVMLQGGLPYADAWEVKGPAAHFAYALALLIFGKTEFAIRAFDLVVNIAGVMAAARIGKIAGRRWVGFVAAGVALGLSTTGRRRSRTGGPPSRCSGWSRSSQCPNPRGRRWAGRVRCSGSPCW